jgi:MoxR-like ATPase
MSFTLRSGLHPRIHAATLRGREGAPYRAHPDLIAAAQVALSVGRPLLLTGEPGCGKTDFAWALARQLDARGELLEAYVRSDSKASDLLYHYDALTRFADAHHGGDAGRARAAEVRNYLRLLPLGTALHDAERRVVLIDEIDKAPRDLPNDLLRELDQGTFEISEIPTDAPEHPEGLRRQMGRAEREARPFMLITSNVERQLPDAFLRRCVFFHIPFPGRERLREILRDRVEGPPALLDRRVAVLEALREVRTLTKKPGTSELIDWARALTVFDEDEVEGALDDFERDLASVTDRSKLKWRLLPALGSLLKLREDLERVGVK